MVTCSELIDQPEEIHHSRMYVGEQRKGRPRRRLIHDIIDWGGLGIAYTKPLDWPRHAGTSPISFARRRHLLYQYFSLCSFLCWLLRQLFTDVLNFVPVSIPVLAVITILSKVSVLALKGEVYISLQTTAKLLKNLLSIFINTIHK